MAKSKAKARPKKLKKTAAANPKKKTAPEVVARPEHTLADVPLADIDPAPAESVRAAYNREALERYEAAYKAGELLPPVDLFSGPLANYLGDGAHRYQARLAADCDTITTRRRRYETDAEAFAAALRFAAGANEEHGLYRSPDDKRAAVAAVIDREEYRESSDREVAALCKVGHTLVGLVRLKLSAEGLIPLSSPAHASRHKYKEDAAVRGGMVRDNSTGELKPAEAEEEGPREGSVLGDPEPGEDDEVVARPPEEEPALPPDPYKTDRFKDCPLLKADGTHQQKGTCRLCAGRGWLSHAEWDGLTDDLRRLAAEREAGEDRVEVVKAAGVDSRLAGARKAAEEAQQMLRKVGAIAEDFLRSENAEELREAADENGVPFECEEDIRGAIPGDPSVQVVKTWTWPALAALSKTFEQLAARLYAE